MRKMIIILVIIVVLGYFLIDKYYIKNMWCKFESGVYEVWGNIFVDIIEKINKGECKCISESLIIEERFNYFNEI